MKDRILIIPIVIFAALLVYQSNHWLIKYSDTMRTWVQHQFISIGDEQDTVMRAFLGEDYILIPDEGSMSYGYAPFYYTFAQAIYHWRNIANSDSNRLRGCRNNSDFCQTTVSYMGVRDSKELYEAFLQDFLSVQKYSESVLCTDSFTGIVIQEERLSDEHLTLGFVTAEGMYSILVEADIQMNDWSESCETVPSEG
ncbi:hypothetical protein CWE13_11185 [Aliidiomarina shirensis]|uniref:Uncharacterized protein n=1 Tax=Aliidiomarina shirensis TaxID=1048642 RepID=A0A432WNW6_9GAMM|nr:hypothetical protein [Aliidiomarina shirensis]RUO35486.1 hypothetical protein CWE13_11185 [Aliidiomarina shirensis]